MRAFIMERMHWPPWVLDGIELDFELGGKKGKLKVPGMTAREVDEIVAVLNLETQEIERASEDAKREVEQAAKLGI